MLRVLKGNRLQPMNRMYIIEDDFALRTELAHLLELQEFSVGCYERFAASPQAASVVSEALDFHPDCILLDLKLPEIDGLCVCRDIRSKSQVPIIILTSSDSEFDEVMAMNLGADDYVTKPYSPAVLMAHIQSVLRRSGQSREELRIVHRDVELNIGTGEVSYHGKSVELPRNELRILSLLMRNPGIILSRQELMNDLWQSDQFIDDNTLTVNVNRLRKSLASIGVPDDFLVTRRGHGYRV